MPNKRYVSFAGTQSWRVDSKRVGIMGFSAGGGVAVGVALAEKSDASPDFLVFSVRSLFDGREHSSSRPTIVYCCWLRRTSTSPTVVSRCLLHGKRPANRPKFTFMTV